jgi:hypothetical protein
LRFASSNRSRLAPRCAKSSGRAAFLERRQSGQQLEELEHNADVPAAPRRELLLAQLIDALAADRDRAGGWPIDAGDHVDDRRLTAARWTDDRNHLAGLDG